MPLRLVAKLTGHLDQPNVKHVRGLPPELTHGKDLREKMDSADFLLIEEKPDGIFLIRVTTQGEVVGDTWHQTVDDAKHQAAHEFGKFVDEWQSVPEDQMDAVSFGVRLFED